MCRSPGPRRRARFGCVGICEGGRASPGRTKGREVVVVSAMTAAAVVILRKGLDVRAGFARAFGKRDDYLRLQAMLRNVEFYIRQVSEYVHQFLQLLSAMNLMVGLQPSPYPEIESKWARFCISSVVDVFREQVAVTESSSRLTYDQLGGRSDGVAAWLRRRGMAAETLVGVLTPRSCQTTVAFLGILEANLAYVPLDVNLPGARIGAILSAVAGRKLCGSATLSATVNRTTRTAAVTTAINRPSATSLVYVTFTSGSTARPKGVMVEHRSIVRLATKTNVISATQAAVPIAHIANPGFNASTLRNWFGTLFTMSTGRRNTTIGTLVPRARRRELCNGVPIGRVVNNSGAYIMDRRQQLGPLGAMEELVVTGDGLARGYTDPALDRDRSVQVQINGKFVRAYRTGDRARYRPKDGQIEFFGRMDQQIKVRGHRIEPAEAERAMLRHETVRDAAAIVRVQEGQEPEMVGFVAAPADGSAEQDRLRDEAAEQLGGWEEKLAARAETEIGSQLRTQWPRQYLKAKSCRRAVVCEEFAAVLGVEIGIMDNFFDQGGHSLMATKLAARLSSRLDTRISAKAVFDQPVLGDLATTIRRSSTPHSPIDGTAYSGPVEQGLQVVRKHAAGERTAKTAILSAQKRGPG
ncbi:hypothetical protein MAPG_01990 [Magnaporthiopsis poae ATCC 64411]|uniref:Carrier domain-containing protein n=1 Tax=Magnaporthiopsis poae (strain ATCC 64411 / 73-15) TaxID=644358 RepID=A0A0C4DQ52_MAGP6|nr:hypothetical protein MAPG_01990 [Magnaporthiopsis poae ATCC 64411]